MTASPREKFVVCTRCAHTVLRRRNPGSCAACGHTGSWETASVTAMFATIDKVLAAPVKS